MPPELYTTSPLRTAPNRPACRTPASRRTLRPFKISWSQENAKHRRSRCIRKDNAKVGNRQSSPNGATRHLSLAALMPVFRKNKANGKIEEMSVTHRMLGQSLWPLMPCSRDALMPVFRKNKAKSKIGKMANGSLPRTNVCFSSLPRCPRPVVYGKRTQKQNGENTVVACSCLSTHPRPCRSLVFPHCLVDPLMPVFRQNKANVNMEKVSVVRRTKIRNLLPSRFPSLDTLMLVVRQNKANSNIGKRAQVPLVYGVTPGKKPQPGQCRPKAKPIAPVRATTDSAKSASVGSGLSVAEQPAKRYNALKQSSCVLRTCCNPARKAGRIVNRRRKWGPNT